MAGGSAKQPRGVKPDGRGPVVDVVDAEVVREDEAEEVVLVVVGEVEEGASAVGRRMTVVKEV